MVFSSIMFLTRFLPIVLVLYYIVPHKFRNCVLFVMSLLFYAWGEPVYILLMLFSTAVDYTHGRLVDRYNRTGQVKKAKLAVSSSVIINLLLLGFFKYVPIDGLALPIGISFYTFQTMSYTIDVYRGEAKVQKNIIDFGTYVSLFPQLIAGPIVQYKTIAKQLNNRRESFDQFSYGVVRFITGLGKKVILANNIGLVWDSISTIQVENLPMITAWIGIIAFGFQIYFDFSGYSDMAIGLGSMFGFRFLENFNYPYQSESITEFWRRWHISLGTWFKEYVYIPLGGNRTSRLKNIRNIAIVWTLTGIWHGASWNFMVWGMYFGIILIIEKVFLLKCLSKLPKILRRIYTLLAISISWAIFAFDSLRSGLEYIGIMFGSNIAQMGMAADGNTWYIATGNIIMLIILAIGATHIPLKVTHNLMHQLEDRPIISIVVQNLYVIVVFTVALAYLVDASYNPFLYFRF